MYGIPSLWKGMWVTLLCLNVIFKIKFFCKTLNLISQKYSFYGTCSCCACVCVCAYIYIYICIYIYSFHGATAPSGPGPCHYRSFTITLRHTTLCRIPFDEWSARRRNLYMTTLTPGRHPWPRQDSNTHPSKRDAADPRLTPRCHWDRLMYPHHRHGQALRVPEF
jgi:hypothetical protein